MNITAGHGIGGNAPGMRKTLMLSGPGQTVAPQFTPVAAVNSSNYYADRKLYEQFMFFKQEFIKIAIRQDVAIPMDMVEDRSNSLKVFMDYNGPKYVFQIIQSNITSMQIIRPGLSLMVTTLALFKKHLPRYWQNNDYPLSAWGNSNQQLSPDELWATQMVPKISDSLTVTGCVSILLSTHNPTIQELVINVIAGLITISDDAITQMLQIPNILYTQTNKKIPTVETSRDKLLQMHLKRITQRLENNLNATGAFPDFTRRSSTQNQSGEDLGGGIRVGTPGSSPPMRHSMRHVDRSNSRISTTRKESTANTNDDFRREEDLFPEEFQSCLSYILSIALMQKNRHLLLAGCADILITMARAGNAALSQYLAQVSTSPLPMIDLQKISNNNRGHSLKHLYTNQAQHTVEPLHVNPLGARIVDWAGIRIPLKFLQRYHQIFGTNHHQHSVGGGGSSTGGGNITSAAAVAPNTSRSGNDAYSESLKAEYRYAHNRALLAICSLLAASHETVAYTVQLSGAIEVIRLSASIFSEDELQSRPLTTATGPSAPSSRVGTGDPESRSAFISRSGAPRNANLPGVILTALNALQLEKHHQQRMKALLNHAANSTNPQQSDSKSNSRKSSVLSLGFGSQSTTHLPSEMVAAANNPNKGNSAVGRPNKLQPLPSSTAASRQASRSGVLSNTTSLTQGAPPKQQVLSQSIHLASHYEVPFEASFQQETEQYQLYIQNKNDQKLYEQAMASPLQFQASKQISTQAKGPLQFQNTTKPDPLLSTSLQEIEHHIHQTLLQTPKASSLSPARLRLTAPLTNGTVSAPSFLLGENSNTTTSNGNLGEGEDRPFLTSAPISPNNHGLSASRDFFGRLPHQPHVPRRIEPKDVIIENEAISKIRKKFQLLGETAVRKIQSSGTEFRNGKNYVPIEERARRVYKPSHSAFFSDDITKKREEIPASAPNPREAQTLQSLEIFDRWQEEPESKDPETLTASSSYRKQSSTAEPTPAWKTSHDLYSAESSRSLANDGPEPYPSSEIASSDHPDAMSLYRVRLDNFEFDEQELFDNFKPIFDFNNPEPDYRSEYGEELLEAGEMGNTTKDYDFYGIAGVTHNHTTNTNTSGTAAAGTTSGYNSNYYKLKSSLQVDQTPDLLL